MQQQDNKDLMRPLKDVSVIVYKASADMTTLKKIIIVAARLLHAITEQ